MGVVGVVLRPGLEARRREPLLLLLGVRDGCSSRKSTEPLTGVSSWERAGREEGRGGVSGGAGFVPGVGGFCPRGAVPAAACKQPTGVRSWLP